ncbi:MAG: hypothetical protein LUC92_06585 [Clostridiales bacterium]|nr:hypothetical protein [Clostridiales bacterium]
MKLPQEYLNKMKDLLDSDFESYLKSFDEERVCGLRANTLKISPEELKSLLNMPLKPVSWCDTGFYYPPSERPSKNPLYNAGLFLHTRALRYERRRYAAHQRKRQSFGSLCCPGRKVYSGSG